MADDFKDSKDSKDTKESKRPPRLRRDDRANASAQEEAQAKGGAFGEPGAKPRRRRADDSQRQESLPRTTSGGGWMDGNAGDKPQLQRHQPTPEITDVQEKNKDKYFNDDVADIIIPDLEEDGAGDAEQRVARAPRNINRHVPTLSELQSDIKAAFPTNEASVDLSILTCTLTPAHLLHEEDKTWTFDSLLREVTEELSKPQQGASMNILPSPSTSTKLTGVGSIKRS